MDIFHPLEVVGRGSKTQLQVGENLYYLIEGFIVKVMKYCVYMSCIVLFAV